MGWRACGGENYFEKKACMVKNGRNFFVKRKKFKYKYTIFIFTFKAPKKFISWTSRKTQILNCFFPVPNVMEFHLENVFNIL